MKTIHIVKILGETMLILGLVGCGSSQTTPGSGPSFASYGPGAITAGYLLKEYSAKAFEVPSSLVDSGNDWFLNGTANCEGGGTATVQADSAPNSNTPHATVIISFSNCAYSKDTFVTPPLLQKTPLSVVANGTYQGTETLDDINKTITNKVDQHMSFGGDIGFGADCTFSLIISTTLTASGSCTYNDSTGAVLSISGDEMTQ
jgi:hypothetical protein